MKFRFLGAEYKVLTDADIFRGDWGECDYDKRLIKIAKGALFGETLLHELIHAVCDRLFEEADSNKDEQRTSQITSIVEAIVRDNPELVQKVIAALLSERKRASGKK